MEPQITPAMLATLEKLVEQHRDDTPADQEALCIKVGQDEPEIGAKLRGIFKLAVAKAKPSSLFLNPPQPKRVEPPKHTPEPEPDVRPSAGGFAQERRRREAAMAARSKA